MKTAYFALVQSHIDYYIILWGHSGASQRLFRLQRRAIGFIANLSYREDCRNHLKKLKVLILPSLYIQGGPTLTIFAITRLIIVQKF
jgi:hypothetical protein